ncbi:sigma-70 family RNA polymerase sigma factor [Flavobacterium arcticum]|uniref:Sigma-70 family RNA polymerase sigma factor n=1 Tax=Flavobacterium arcticum TaxID=1784713 RepID=A0A345HAX4_9FLAO|nr:sigma-70 family RNA polymerase sigma factor [Flavobacterium arcticum]AXG73734.1 sigma-70 family RNA polymerase sigma factor [Flavobacterium arcticum]KAF2511685.1 sigma-70 family RNA polymerase sigma factor [Flavobacterium arcticum]
MGIEQLIKDCQQDSIKAQEQLYRLFAPKLFAVCLKYSRNYEDAQDNLQDGFLLLFRKIGQFQFKGSFEGWAKRLMVNNVLQRYRSEGIFEIVSENMPDEAEVEIESDSVSMDFLLSIIQGLPDRYRMVFNLYVTDGYSHKEIADMLGITVGTSKSNLSRARIILKGKIEAQEGNSKNTYSK